MQKLFYLIIIANIFFSCSKKLLPNSKGADSLIRKINKNIESKGIKSKAAIFFKDTLISDEYLELLNEIKIEEFEEITFLNKSEAIKKFGQRGKYGAVQIQPYEDETLSLKYYSNIKNAVILAKIQEHVKAGDINANPILILNGMPLRAESISNRINELNEDSIKDIIVMNKDNKVILRLYGIRAINGVLLITIE